MAFRPRDRVQPVTCNLPFGNAKGEEPVTLNLQPSTLNIQFSTLNLQP
ncbi:MAG: hypothetical protein F6K53_38080 [Moorea sp. SIO4A1]|nr:hypothetical protein [Moorena sp. SIO4A1]NEQ62867.1 hypothetical protein [Moorena sp. SIO4A1]